jgi:hypothetical protein
LYSKATDLMRRFPPSKRRARGAGIRGEVQPSVEPFLFTIAVGGNKVEKLDIVPLDNDKQRSEPSVVRAYLHDVTGSREGHDSLPEKNGVFGNGWPCCA